MLGAVALWVSGNAFYASQNLVGGVAALVAALMFSIRWLSGRRS